MGEATPSYAEQDSSQSLREGLAEYYARNPNLLDPSTLPADAEELFRQHDAGHALGALRISAADRSAIATTRALGTRPCARAIASEATTMAAAPSFSRQQS